MGESISGELHGREKTLNREPAQRIESKLSTEAIEHFLKEKGVFSSTQNPTTGQESLVVDEEAMQGALESLFVASQNTRDRWTRGRMFQELPGVFGNTSVLTTAQVAAGDFEEKPFFYIPESADAATDTVAIKNANFHHLIFDYVPRFRGSGSEYPHPTVQGNDKQSISAYETRVAALIFHPKYGDGFRNEKNQLFVREKNTRQYKRFSGEFLDEYGVDRNWLLYPEGTRNKEFTPNLRTVREGAAVEMPNLVGKKLIQPVQDFKQLTFKTGQTVDRRIERAGVSPSGSRMIRKVIHYIGKEFVGKNVRIVDISPTLGAVVDMSGGIEKVTHTFNIIPPDKAQPTTQNMYLANAPLTQTRPFSAEHVALPRRRDESPEQYYDRTDKTDRGLALLLLHVFPKYPELSKMLRDRPVFEQTSIAQAAYLLEKDKQTGRFDEFVEKYGEAGARTFLVTAHNERLREQVFEFAESVPEENAQTVFQAYGRVIDTVDALDAYLQNQFGSENKSAVSEISSRVLARASNILASAHVHKNDPEKLVALVESVRADVHLFTDTCRTLKEHGALSLENIRNGELEVANGAEFKTRPQEAAKLVSIQHERYRNKYPPELERQLREGLTHALESPDSRFYMFRLKSEEGKEGKLVSFLRFDDERDNTGALTRKHFGSVMTNIEFAGGKLGEALVETAIKRESEDGVPIYAECDPDSPAWRMYERLGFTIKREYMENGVPTLDIELVSQAEASREAA